MTECASQNWSILSRRLCGDILEDVDGRIKWSLGCGFDGADLDHKKKLESINMHSVFMG
jgi:hypothetical protein